MNDTVTRFRTDVFSILQTVTMDANGLIEWPVQSLECISYCVTREYVTSREVIDALTARIHALGRASYKQCLEEEIPLTQVAHPHALAFAMATDAILPFEVRQLPFRIIQAQKDFILWFMPNMRQILTGVPVESYLFS